MIPSAILPIDGPRRGTASCAVAALGWMLLLLGADPALAQQERAPGAPSDLPGLAATSSQPSDKEAPAPGSIESSLGRDEVRTFFATKGIAYSLTYIGETFGVASGGQQRGGIYEGRLDGQLDADLGRLFGWEGATFHTNAYQIHGRGLSRYYLGNLFATSSIEALPSTRLFELWLEQKFLGDTVSVRAGQLAADAEFIVSQYAALFVNGTFGWPGSVAADLPSGGPAFPLATPGVRVKWAATPDLTLMAAVFNGDPAGPGPGDPQVRNPDGLAFRVTDPALLIGEGAYSYNQGKDATGLPGTVKLGAWLHAGRFDDLRRAASNADAPGLLLADPASSGTARRLRGNQGIYAVLDQTLYRAPGGDQGLGLFVRGSASPGDRNLVEFYADGGLTYKGLLPNRLDDTAGMAFGYARISSSARGFDRDTAFYNADTFSPVRSSEALVEVTYQAQIVPGWTVQPDFQYVWRPGGNVVNPRNPFAVTRDAAIVGLRTSIRY